MKKLCGMVIEVPAISVTVDGIKNTDHFAYCSGTISTWKGIIWKSRIVYLGICMGGLQTWSSGILLQSIGRYIFSSGFPRPFIYLDLNFYQVCLAFAAVAHWSVHLSVTVLIGYFQKYEFSDAKDRRAAAAKVGQNHSKDKSFKDH